MDSTGKTRACPTCEKPVLARERVKSYPFCSDRCQLADLGKWLDGSYAIPEPDTSFD